MKIQVEYCTQWNYAPQAAGLAAELGAMYPDADIELIPGGGGAFEVTVEGTLVYSKHALNRFPAYQEVPGLIG